MAAVAKPTVLVVVEGINDIEFLRRISRILHAADAAVPDLDRLERQGNLLFLPVGGSTRRHWFNRLASLGVPEFHLFDRDEPPLTEEHRQLAARINRRQGCRAAVTRKRQLESYLHPQALFLARGLSVSFSDDADVADVVACHCFRAGDYGKPVWHALPSRSRRRLRGQAKRWLNREAVDAMTAELLHERDPAGEVRGWLETIRRLAIAADSTVAGV